MKQTDLEPSATGDCFEVAGRNVIKSDIPELKLVHAVVLGQGKLGGKHFVHAWNEVGDVVFDYSNGNQVVMRREQYYKLGQVDASNPALYHSYDGTQAMVNMAKYKHWGPWDLD